jgi:RND family efflux transporter MFP subunit
MLLRGAAAWVSLLATGLIALLVGVIGTVVVMNTAAGGGPVEDAAAGPPEQGGPPPGLVRFGETQQQTLQQRYPAVGRLQAVQRSTVAAQVEGQIVKAPLIEGQTVVRGQLLAVLDDDLLQADMDAALAQIAAAQATVDDAVRRSRQLDDLATTGSAPQREVDAAAAALSSARSSLQAAEAQAQRVARRLERTIVIAPFDGVVIAEYVERGQWVGAGDPVVQMVSRGEIDAVVEVPERVVNDLAEGEQVELIVEPLGLRLQGELMTVVPDGSNLARVYTAKVRLDDQDGRLKPGMSVTANLPITREAQLLTVPRDAVLQTARGSEVWVGVPMGGPLPSGLPVPVRVLFGHEDRFAVSPLDMGTGVGLSDGTPVVVEGAERLFPTRPLMTPEQAATMNGSGPGDGPPGSPPGTPPGVPPGDGPPADGPPGAPGDDPPDGIADTPPDADAPRGS